MSTNSRIYHNPRCSKSRQTLALLEEAGIKPQVVRYLETPLTEAELSDILTKLNLPAHAILRPKEAPYQECGLSKDSDTAQILQAIVEHPILLERPIVVHKNKAVIGRPPEKVQELL